MYRFVANVLSVTLSVCPFVCLSVGVLVTSAFTANIFLCLEQHIRSI